MLTCPQCGHGLQLVSAEPAEPAPTPTDQQRKLTEYLAVVRTTSVQMAACFLFDTASPDRNRVEQTRRRLDRMVRRGQLVKRAGSSGGISGGVQTMYTLPGVLAG